MNTLDRLIESGLHNIVQPLKLHMGCGQTRLEGYVNIDYPQDKHNVMTSAADAEADIVKDLVFPRLSVDEIRSHHFFEHLSRVIAIAQLVKWYYWLKVDGTLIIETPDFMTSVAQLMDENTQYDQKMCIVRHLTGDQAADWGYHKELWWNERFETTLSVLGFHVVEIEKTQWQHWPHLASITVKAIKLEKKDVDGQIELARILLRDSMVSEREQATYEIWCKQLDELLEGFC